MANASEDFLLRPAQDDDRESLIALVDSAYAEYGDRVCLEGAERDLAEAPDWYRQRGGEIVVLVPAVGPGEVVGSHAALPSASGPGVAVFRRLYLRRDLRGRGLGRQLMEWALAWCHAEGQHRVEFWSDTRFSAAHAFFARLGFERDGREREMHDGYTPYREWFFFREVGRSQHK